MSNAITGGFSLTCNLVETIVPGGSLASYPIPIQPGAQNVSYGYGTAANQAQKVAQLQQTATAAPVDVDLSTLQCVDGATGFAHVRELILINLDAAHTLATGDDGVVTNPWVPFASGTHPVRTVEPGAHHRVSKPLGTNGYVVDSTHKTVRVDPGANTVAFILIVVGD